jgi:hypothetical protein
MLGPLGGDSKKQLLKGDSVESGFCFYLFSGQVVGKHAK